MFRAGVQRIAGNQHALFGARLSNNVALTRLAPHPTIKLRMAFLHVPRKVIKTHRFVGPTQKIWHAVKRPLLTTSSMGSSKTAIPLREKLQFLLAIGVTTIGVLMLKIDKDDGPLKYLLLDLFGQSAPPEDLVVASDVIDLPILASPEEYDHPYNSRPMWWQWLFTIRRCFWLAVNLIPVAWETILLALDSQNPQKLEIWCDALVRYINRAGCSFQKFGQWVSMRPDMFPPAMIKACSRLQDEVPCHKFEDTVTEIEESLGKPMDELFESFDPEPVASGSVAQVYKAELKPEFALHDGGTTVAIKVRHPTVLDETYVDLKIIFGCIPILNVIFGWTTGKDVAGEKRTAEIVMPFSTDSLFSTIQKQLDFKYEAFNILEFHRNFFREIQDPNMHVSFPIVSTELLSDSILVESWIPGKTIASMFATMKDVSKEMQRRLATEIFDITAKMFLRDNFIHGDLHAGNLLFHDGSQNLAVMDAGLVTTLPADIFNEFGDFIRALCTRDTVEMRDKLLLFHDFNAKNAVPTSKINAEALWEDLEDIFVNGAGVQRPGVPLAQALGDIIGDMLRRLGSHGVLLRGDVASCIMTISVAEGLVMSLDPDLDVLQTALPYFVRYRGWASADAILDSGYETSERKAKDLVEEFNKPLSEASDIAKRKVDEAELMVRTAADQVLGNDSAPKKSSTDESQSK